MDAPSAMLGFRDVTQVIVTAYAEEFSSMRLPRASRGTTRRDTTSPARIEDAAPAPRTSDPAGSASPTFTSTFGTHVVAFGSSEVRHSDTPSRWTVTA